jgi:hypothetical protein
MIFKKLQYIAVTIGLCEKKRLVAWLPSLLGVGLAVTLIGGMMGAWFCINDDHMHVDWLNAQNHGSLSGIWSALMGTEFGEFGSSIRFKPVFWLHAVLENAAFGEHVGFYYALRVFYFAMFLGAVGWLAARVLGPISSVILVVGLSGWRLWINLWTLSLGSTEAIAVPGIALVIIGYGAAARSIIDDTLIPRWTIRVVAIGTTIAAGSKESFPFLLLPFICFLAVCAWKKRVREIDLFWIAPFLVVPLLVIWTLWIARIPQADFYGIDNSVWHRIGAILQARIYAGVAVLSAIGGLLLTKIALGSAQNNSRTQRAIYIAFGTVAITVCYLLWEVFFFNGRLPAGNRYDFPSMLLPLVILGGLVVLLRYAFPLRNKWLGQAFQVFMLACAFVPWYHAGPLAVFDGAMAAAHRTHEFHKGLLALARTVSAHPDWPIVIEPNKPFDYESVATFQRWQRYLGVSNPVVVRVEIQPGDIKTPFDRQLADQMQLWAANGVPGQFEPQPDPSSLATLGSKCFVFATWKAPVSNCVHLDYRPGEYMPTS